MAATVTKDPRFHAPQDIQQENDRRNKSIEQFLKKSPEEIRAAIRCTLAGDVGRPHIPPAGKKLFVQKRWLVRPQDRKEYDTLARERVIAPPRTTDPEQIKNFIAMVNMREQQIEAILRAGSDHLRACVARAADWACVPAELLAAVLQNENSQYATDTQRGLQGMERGIQSVIGKGSTGFGNVKPETLEHMTALFHKFYKSKVLGPGVQDVGQNKNVETDIYHAAAALRDGLNKAWSAHRSLNKEKSKRYAYYPYFGGPVTEEVAIRAMGHYNGMGDDAMTYGKHGMKRIQKQPLYFLPPK